MGGKRKPARERVDLFRLVSLRLSAFVVYFPFQKSCFAFLMSCVFSPLLDCCLLWVAFFCCVIRIWYADISFAFRCSFAIIFLVLSDSQNQSYHIICISLTEVAGSDEDRDEHWMLY